MKILPIQLAMPDSKVLPLSNSKTMIFSDMTPLGRTEKYKFYVEKEYYEHYAKAYFAVTMKKGGWDCMRHYEILASGTLPYFLDIENCPPQTLFAWPKELMVRLKQLAGMPSERKVIRAAKSGKLKDLSFSKDFDEKQYWALHGEFMDYFHKHLTTKGLAKYFLEANGIKGKTRVLLCFGIHATLLDYMRDLLVSALGADPDVSLVVYPLPFWQLKSCHREILNTFYGRGFSCTATLDTAQMEPPYSWEEIVKEIDNFDLIVATTTSNQGFQTLPQEVQDTLSMRKDVVWVDGNDIKANHEIPSCAKLVFRREMEDYKETGRKKWGIWGKGLFDNYPI